MKIECMQIDEDLRLQPLPVEEALAASHKKDARIWIDLQDFQPEELEEWLDRLEVTALPRQLSLEAVDRPGFYPLRNEIFLVIPILTGTPSQLGAEHMALLCRENLLLTMHRSKLMSAQELATLEDSTAWLSGRSIAALVSALWISVSQTFLRHTACLRVSIVALEEKMEVDPDSVEAETIQDLRSELIIQEGVMSDQLPSLQGLSATDKPFFKQRDTQEYMNCALVNLQSADRTLTRLAGRLTVLRGSFQMHAQEKTNSRLGMLTVLSAIFMPITLMAGIWGMNFESMPELSVPHSYPIALGLMVVVGGGMYLFFRRSGWFN